MRILVDQSGYALLNIGDIAMLQACVFRLHDLWPDADIQVLADSPERLAQYCPGLTAVSPSIIGRSAPSRIPLSFRPAAEKVERRARSLQAGRKPELAGNDLRWEPSRLHAIRQADIVVSSGGGFINDVFWRHGAKVMGSLAVAQRFGKPTAVFSQGIGPLTNAALIRLLMHSMPRLAVIGLREGLGSAALLGKCGVESERFQVTGDDALLLATPKVRPPTGTGVGLNIRVAFYSGIDTSVASEVVTTTTEFANGHDVATVALPVSRYKGSSDLEAIQLRSSGQPDSPTDNGSDDVRSPEELVDRTARCRVIVTGSYHAAVFGLAAGVPAVCVTNSRYYDQKFEGLDGQFPGGCHLARPGPGFERDLSDAIGRAWDTCESDRDRLHSAAQTQVQRAEDAYTRFKALLSR